MVLWVERAIYSVHRRRSAGGILVGGVSGFIPVPWLVAQSISRFPVQAVSTVVALSTTRLMATNASRIRNTYILDIVSFLPGSGAPTDTKAGLSDASWMQVFELSYTVRSRETTSPACVAGLPSGDAQHQPGCWLCSPGCTMTDAAGTHPTSESKALTRLPVPDNLILVFIHGFKGNDETFLGFPQRLQHVLQDTIPNCNVDALIFPAYEVRTSLAQ